MGEVIEGGLLNSLVGDYLASLGSKLAAKFWKETKATPLPPGSPGLKEMVTHFQATSPVKRKLELPGGDSPAKKTKKAIKVEEMQEAEDSSSSDDEEDADESKSSAESSKNTKSNEDVRKKSDESEEDSSDEEEEKSPASKPSTKAATKEESSEDDDSSSDEDEEKSAVKVDSTKTSTASKESDEDSSSSDEEEAATVKEAEPELKITNNKNKSQKETPVSGNNESIGTPSRENEEGRKIFIHNVSEEATYEDFQETVEKIGEVTDFFNPGRGFAFITFSTNEEAQSCIAQMNNTDVGGRTIQMNIARPKGDKGGDRGGRGGGRGGGGGGGRREEVEGAKVFVHNVSEETGNDDLKKAFGKHGTIADAYNTGKGFAFITFSSAGEAQAAISAMNGTNVCGRDIECNVAARFYRPHT